MNIGRIDTRGIDLDLTKNFYFDAGQLALRTQATHLLEYMEYNDQSGTETDRVDYVGTTGGLYVDWRGLAGATWYGNDWEVGADIQYLSDGESSYKPVEAMTYLNLKAGWDMSDALRLSAGIDNATDEEPEDTSGYGDWNSSYDFQGRYAWAGVSYQF